MGNNNLETNTKLAPKKFSRLCTFKRLENKKASFSENFVMVEYMILPQ